METPVSAFRLKTEVVMLLKKIVEQTRLSPAIIVSDGIKLVAERELGKRKRMVK